MGTDASERVRYVQQTLLPCFNDATSEDLKRGLMKAWDAWDYGSRRREVFGANSFKLIALGVIFDCLEKLGVSLEEK